MRTGLIVLGVIFIVFGGVLYYMPTPTAGAVTTTVSQGNSNTRASFASISVPMQLTMASLIIGSILLILGLLIPGYGDFRGRRDASKDYIVQTKEHITGDGNKRDVIRERREERIEKTA